VFSCLCHKAWFTKLWERGLQGKEVRMDLQGCRAQLWTSGNYGPVQAGLAPPTLCPRVKEEVHFSDRHKGTVWPEPCSSESGLWTSSTGIPGTY